jgi:hypothetical protein
MTSPSATAEAAIAPASMSASDKAAEFEQFLDPEEDGEQETDPESEEIGDDDLEEGEEADETEDEPATAIDPPASLNAAEKEAFAAASPEAQQAWAAAETRRNAQVQEATTKASEAQRTAEARAASADAQAKAVFGKQLDEFIAAFEPEMPDPRAYSDNLAYLTAEAQWRGEKAQHDALVQQVRAIQAEAGQEVDQAFLAQRDREIQAHPKIANHETRDTYVKGIMELASEVGLDVSNIANHATGEEFLALAKVFDRLSTAEEKAAKYDKAVSRKMQKVRSARGRNLRPNAAPQDSRAAQGNRDWGRVTTARTKEQREAAFADYLGL